MREVGLGLFGVSLSWSAVLKRIATIPAENEKSNLRVCAQRIARMAAAEIFIVLMIMDFIEKL